MKTRINSRIFLFQLAVLVVVLSLSFVFDSSADTAVGLSMAVTGMMTIGDIEDVSDRQTHGSNIAYQIYLISIDQVDNSQLFPAPNANREVGQVPMKNGEYMKYFGLKDRYDALDKYVLEGGMSGSYLYKDQEAKYDYIADVFDTLIVRDIRKKYKIRNTQLMDRIVDFLMDNVSNLSSARNITNTLGSMQEKIHHTTVGNYMQYLCNAFAFYKVRRYDIKGKKYLSSNDKYYLSDHTFRYAKLGTKNMDYGRILENIVAIELLRRGYEVYVGILYKKEIDFVAVKRSEKIYIQVSDNISEEKTFEREVAPLLQIKDAYPKYVIARTRHDEYQYEGIKVIDIADWLLDK